MMRTFFRLIIILSVVFSGLFGMPAHKKLLEKIKNGEVKQPYFLTNLQGILKKGVNSTAVLPDGSRPYNQNKLPKTNFNAIAILVKFTDNPSSVGASFFDNLIFGTSTGTVNDYYNEISYGTLSIVTVNLPSSTGWQTAPQTYSYYVNAQQGFGTYPQNAQKLVEDVVALADPLVDFSQYDNNADGFVDALFIIHSGPGAEFTGSLNDIWSHKWNTSAPQTVDGVSVFSYSIEPEYWSTPGDMTCGVYAHEMGHAVFGLPDLYDRDYSSEGLGDWSLMAGGSWNGTLGNSPAHPDAWSRSQMGFVSPTNVITNQTGVTIPGIENTATEFRLWTNGSVGQQYFLVENRDAVGYDAALPGAGLLIYHVDEDVATQNDDENHYLVALEQADGLLHLESSSNQGDAGDPFPGSSINYTFDDVSNPNSRSYFNSATQVAVRNISNAGPSMTADLEVGSTTTWGGDFLIWDPDPTPLSGPEFKSLLEGLGYTVDYTSTITTVPDLSIYQAVFICLGIYNNNYVLNENDAQLIIPYLDAGGKVYMEGGDTWAFDMQTSLHPYFNIQGIADGSGDLSNVNGITGTFTEGLGFSYAGENVWIDRIGPLNGAFTIFENPAVPYDCAVAYDDTAGSYKTIGTSFEFGGLTDGTSPNTKAELLSRILNFFNLGGKPAPTNLVAGDGFDGRVPLTWNPPSNVVPKFDRILSDNRNSGISRNRRASKKDQEAYLKKLLVGRKVNSNFIKAPSDTVSYYKIYRSTTSGGPYTYVSSVDPHGRPYLDNEDFIDYSVLNGVAYYYVVTAVYSDGSESGYSQEYTATPVLNGMHYTSNYTSISPTLDGVISPGEWSDATIIDIAAPDISQPILMYMKNDDNYLYIAVDNLTNLTDTDYNEIAIYFDDDNNDTWDPIPSDEGNYWIDLQAGLTTSFYRPISGDYPNTVNFGTLVISAPGVADSASLSSGNVQYEIQIDLLASSLTGAPGDQIGLMVFDSNPENPSSLHYNYSGFFPFGGVWAAPETYAKITLGTAPLPPTIDVSPASFTFNVQEGALDSSTLTIANTTSPGGNDLIWSLSEQNLKMVADNGREIPVTIQTNGLRDLVSSNGTSSVTFQNRNQILSTLKRNKPSGFGISNSGTNIKKVIESMIERSTVSGVQPAGDAESLAGGSGVYSGYSVIDSPEQAANVKYASDETAKTLYNVAILGNPSYLVWNDEVQAKLLATGFFSSVAIINISSVTPTLAELLVFDAVLVYSDYPPILDPVGLGDNLADYVDAGGGVVCAVFADASFPIGGRFNTENYWAIPPSGQTSVSQEYLGMIYDPGHPILSGVSGFDGGTSSYRQSSLNVDPAATRIADWTDGRALIATRVINGVNRVDLGFFPPSSDSRADLWNSATDGALILANSLVFTTGGVGGDCAWISESPLSGAIPAGGNTPVNLIVDATGLAPGTYNCNLLISGNDPVTPLVTVPVILNVTTAGPPPSEFAVVTNTFDASIHIVDVQNNTISGPYLAGQLGSTLGYLLDPVITPDGQTALISNFSDQTVFFVDVSNPYTPVVIDSVFIGFYAEDIALTPDGAFAVIADGNSSTSIAVVDVSTATLIQTLDITPKFASAVAIAPDGTILICDYVYDQVYVMQLNLTTGQLTDPAVSIPVTSGPLNVAISPDGETAIVAPIYGQSVDVLQLTGPATVTHTGTVPNIRFPQSIAFDPSGQYAYVVETGSSPDSLAVLSVNAPGTVTDTGIRIGLVSDAAASVGYFGVDVLDVSSNGKWAYVGNPAEGTTTELAVVDLTANTLATTLTAGTYPSGITVGGVTAPQVDFSATLAVFDNCSNIQNLVFGTAPTATDGFDAGLDQYAPPPPPTGAFDARFHITADDLLKDFRATNTGTVKWDLEFVAASGCEPATVQWDPADLPNDGTMFWLVDFFTEGTLVKINMRTDSSYVDVNNYQHFKIINSLTANVCTDLADGWNLIGISVIPVDTTAANLFPNMIPPLYGFNGSYVASDYVHEGNGYWERNTVNETVCVEGYPVSAITLHLTDGWNLVAGPSSTVAIADANDPGGIIIPGTLYEFNGAYSPSDSLVPGVGYWLKVSAAGDITLSTVPKNAGNLSKKIVEVQALNEFSALTIEDAAGNHQNLYLGVKLEESQSIENFSLPPTPPGGMYDARFAGGYRVSTSDEATIQVQASNYPLRFKLNVGDDSGNFIYVMKEMNGNKVVASHSLLNGETIEITNPQSTTFKLTKETAVPRTFAVRQNFPNPFNPVTNIAYAIPQDVKVEIVVYNSLGQKVRQLLSKNQKAGYYNVEWDGTSDTGKRVGSGIYYYRITAGKHNAVKKMILLK